MPKTSITSLIIGKINSSKITFYKSVGKVLRTCVLLHVMISVWDLLVPLTLHITVSWSVLKFSLFVSQRMARQRMVSMDLSILEVLNLCSIYRHTAGTLEWCLWMDELQATTEAEDVRRTHSLSWFYHRTRELGLCKGKKLS